MNCRSSAQPRTQPADPNKVIRSRAGQRATRWHGAGESRKSAVHDASRLLHTLFPTEPPATDLRTRLMGPTSFSPDAHKPCTPTPGYDTPSNLANALGAAGHAKLGPSHGKGPFPWRFLKTGAAVMPIAPSSRDATSERLPSSLPPLHHIRSR